MKFFIGRVAFDQLGPERATALNAVETRLRLPADQVEMLITAGRDALKSNAVFRSFLNSLSPGKPRPARPAPVASPLLSRHEADAAPR